MVARTRQHSFAFKQYVIEQQQCAMKVTTDACLFGALVALPEAHGTPYQVLDIGTGTGLLALMIAQRHANAMVTAIEIEADAAVSATANAAQSPYASRIAVRHQSLQQLLVESNDGGPQFDLMICNPPFFKAVTLPRETARVHARHQITLTYADLFAAAAQLLTASGSLEVLLPSVDVDLVTELGAQHLSILYRTDLKHNEQRSPHRTILRFGKRPTATPSGHEMIAIYDPEPPSYNPRSFELLRPFYRDL